VGRILKSACIGIVIFFGSGFSIMAFHNDIGIVNLFAQIYEQVIGAAPDGMGGLELGYSVGLALGILLFFNHISLRKKEQDPTPLQVEMSKYEQDVEDTIERIRQKEEQQKNKKQEGQT
jgi:stage V sporulation protein AA